MTLTSLTVNTPDAVGAVRTRHLESRNEQDAGTPDWSRLARMEGSMSQTLLSRADRVAQSREFRKAILDVLDDGKDHTIADVLEQAAARCHAFADDVAPVLSSAAASHHLSINFVDGTVRKLS